MLCLALFFFFVYFCVFFFFFFFQAEDGIRDRDVTGVQTCALPISLVVVDPPGPAETTTKGPQVLHAAGWRPQEGAALTRRQLTDAGHMAEVVDGKSAAEGASQGAEVLHAAGCRPDESMLLARGRLAQADDLPNVVNRPRLGEPAAERAEVCNGVASGGRRQAGLHPRACRGRHWFAARDGGEHDGNGRGCDLRAHSSLPLRGQRRLTTGQGGPTSQPPHYCDFALTARVTKGASASRTALALRAESA